VLGRIFRVPIVAQEAIRGMHLLLAGYAIALPFAVGAGFSVARIPRPLWLHSTHYREVWLGGLLGSYLCFGLPAIIVSLAWFASDARSVLREEQRRLRDEQVELEGVRPRRRRRRQRASA
jgi:hypothetical protein